MAYVVAIAFRSGNRRFSPGDPVTADDVAATASMTFTDWVNGGFIVGSDVFYQVVASIASGQSLSAAIALNRRELVGIIMPAAWDTADLTFQVSIDGGSTWSELYLADTGQPVVVNAAAGRALRTNPDWWKGIDTLRIRSGLAAAAVVQTAARALTLTVRPAT